MSRIKLKPSGLLRRVSNRLFLYFLVNAALFSAVFFPLGVKSYDNRILILFMALFLLNVLFCAAEYKLFLSRVADIISVRERALKGIDVGFAEKYFDDYADKLALQFKLLKSEVGRVEDSDKTFLSNVSHELRTPLTSVQGFLTAVLDGTIPENERENYLKITLDEVRRLSEIVVSMLNLSRLESGRFPIMPHAFDLNKTINDVVFKLNRKAAEKNIVIGTHFFSQNCIVLADGDRIEQVLINIIDNAIKYSPSYSVISVSTSRDGGRAFVSVGDRGVGISSEEREKIFDRFYIADRTQRSKGTGLGLSIVKKIIDGHRQTITVESKPGEGSVFTFSLALHQSGGKEKRVKITGKSGERRAAS